MLKSAIPTRFQLAWAKNAGGSFIRTPPVASQIGIQDGAASYNDGFVPNNFTPLAAGGVPPFGQDMNGVLNETTAWDIWYQAGAAIPYDATFATAIGGYPQGAVLDSSIVNGVQWCSQVDSNLTNPDDPLTSTNWTRVGMPAGTPVPSFSSTTPSNLITMNALTIGNAASNAGYAAADALFLFVANWLNFSNTQCPILTSAGAPSTRGANAVADFNANKQLTLPNGKGLSLIGADTMGGAASTFLNGVPVTIGNSSTPGSILGENLHTNLLSETPTGIVSGGSNSIVVASSVNVVQNGTIVSQANAAGGTLGLFNTPGVANGILTSSSANTISVTSTNTGGGAHNTVQRDMVVFWGQVK